MDDSSSEALESFSVSLSNATNATLARSAATVRIVDNEPIIDNESAIADAYSKALDHIQTYLNRTIATKLSSETLSVGGFDKSYATLLNEYANVADVETWVAQYTSTRRQGAIKSLKSFTRSIKSQVAAVNTGTQTANDLAVGLTKIMTGVRSIDFATIQGGVG